MFSKDELEIFRNLIITQRKQFKEKMKEVKDDFMRIEIEKQIVKYENLYKKLCVILSEIYLKELDDK